MGYTARSYLSNYYMSWTNIFGHNLCLRGFSLNFPAIEPIIY